MTDTLELIAACLAEEKDLIVQYDEKTHLEDGAGFVMVWPKGDGPASLVLINIDPASGHMSAASTDHDDQTLFELADPEGWAKLRTFILKKRPGVSFGAIQSSTPTEKPSK